MFSYKYQTFHCNWITSKFDFVSYSRKKDKCRFPQKNGIQEHIGFAAGHRPLLSPRHGGRGRREHRELRLGRRQLREQLPQRVQTQGIQRRPLWQLRQQHLLVRDVNLIGKSSTTTNHVLYFTY